MPLLFSILDISCYMHTKKPYCYYCSVSVNIIFISCLLTYPFISKYEKLSENLFFLLVEWLNKCIFLFLRVHHSYV